MPRQSRAWCFTLNNYQPNEIEQLHSLTDSEEVCYLIAGEEVGEQGTPHLQGYLELRRKKTLRGLKNLLTRSLASLSRVHLESRRGSQTQAIDYCKKDGAFREFGQCLQQGSRGDLLAVKRRLDDGESLHTIAASEESFSLIVRYRRGLEWYAGRLTKPRDFKSRVTVLYGPTGTGKTKRAWDFARVSDEDMFVWPGGEWFDGYRGHRIVLFDDFHGGLGFRMCLRLFDRYPMQVPVKGGYVEWCPEKIFITSNSHPNEWFPDELDAAPLLRRFEHIIEVSSLEQEMILFPLPENAPGAAAAEE